MNKPIRTMAIGCLALFVALLVNSTYLQYLRADELNSRNDNKRVRDAEFSRERGAILVRGNSVGESVPVDDEFKFQRRYPQPQKYAHLTGYYSYTYGRNSVELTENDILSGSDPRLFVNRVVDMFGNTQPKGGDVSLTIDPKAQTAAYEGLRNLGGTDIKGSVVALDPSTGAILAMVSSPTYNPNSLASHDMSRSPSPGSGSTGTPSGRCSTAASRRSTPRVRPSSWSPRRPRSPAVSTPPARRFPAAAAWTCR